MKIEPPAMCIANEEQRQQAKDARCPYIQRKRVGDESYDMCKETDKSCLIEHGHYECEIYNDFKKEELDENDNSGRPHRD